MFNKLLLTTMMTCFLSGCVYSVHTTKLEPPISKPKFESEITEVFHSIMSIDNQVQVSSIGDELFHVARFIETTQTAEIITHLSPVSRKFPQNATWSATYKFNDGKSGDLFVYTSPSFFESQIGVILDNELVVATDEPLVQVSGVKEGRRWKFYGQSEFFKVTEHLHKRDIEKPWGLRFGGVEYGYYNFEIVNRTESTSAEILQRIKISEEEFLSGFIVRDIFIKGIQKYRSGVIKFKARDLQVPQPNKQFKQIRNARHFEFELAPVITAQWFG